MLSDSHFVSCRYVPVLRNEEMNSHATQRNAANNARRILPSAHIPFPAVTEIGFGDCERSSLSNTASVSANPNRLFDRQDAASYLGIKPQTLANWAVTRTQNLPYVKIGRRVMYRLADLEAFVMANLHGDHAFKSEQVIA